MGEMSGLRASRAVKAVAGSQESPAVHDAGCERLHSAGRSERPIGIDSGRGDVDIVSVSNGEQPETPVIETADAPDTTTSQNDALAAPEPALAAPLVPDSQPMMRAHTETDPRQPGPPASLASARAGP